MIDFFVHWLTVWSVSGFVTAKTTDEFTNWEIAASELTSSSWNKFVYRVYEGANVDQDTCTAMCVFDSDRISATLSYGCHFTVFDGSKCYLGSIDWFDRSLVPSITANNLNFKHCKLMITRYIRYISKYANLSLQMRFKTTTSEAPCFPTSHQWLHR